MLQGNPSDFTGNPLLLGNSFWFMCGKSQNDVKNLTVNVVKQIHSVHVAIW